MTRSEHLFEILGGLDDELVEEAAQPVATTRPVVWRRWAALAACALLVAGVWNLAQTRMGGAASGGDSNSKPKQSQEEIVSDAVCGDGAPAEDPEQAENRVGSAAPSTPAAAPLPTTAPTGPGTATEGANKEDTPVPQPFHGQYDATTGSNEWLEALNQELTERVKADGLPDQLAVYVDGEVKETCPLLSREEALAAPRKNSVNDYGNFSKKKLESAAADLCYVSREDGVTLPCWRFTLADGSTVDVPAVEAQYLEELP